MVAPFPRPAFPDSLEDILDINEYTGRTAIHRLLHISQNSPSQPLTRQVLLALIPLIKAHTLDTNLYGSVVTRLLNMSGAPSSGGDGMDIDHPSSTSVDAPQMSSSIPTSSSFPTMSTSLGRAPASRLPAGAGNASADLEAKGSVDSEWIEAAGKKAQVEGLKLESELKGYMSNLIKESCRLTYHSLAAHHLLTGDYQSALKALSKAREYNSNPQHELQCSLCIIEVSLLVTPTGYSTTLPAVVKAEYALSRILGTAATGAANRGGVAGDAGLTAQQARDREREREEMAGLKRLVGVKCKVARGVCGLGAGQWESGGKEMGGVEGKLDDWEGRVFASSDVAIYTAFLSLATLSRSQLKSNFLENDNLRHYLDNGSAGYVRDLIDCFVDARYGAMLDILRKNYWRHALDPYLGPKLDELTNLIVQKSYIQYFQPFQQVTFARMAQAFGYVKEGDDEAAPNEQKERMISDVVKLVERGRMKGRIDMIDLVLESVKVDQRAELFKEAMEMGKRVDSAMRRSHLRMKLIEAKILVEDPKNKKTKKNNDDDADYSPDEMDTGDMMDMDDGDMRGGKGSSDPVDEDLQMQIAMEASLQNR